MYVTGSPWGHQCVDCCVSDGLDLDALQTVQEWEREQYEAMDAANREAMRQARDDQDALLKQQEFEASQPYFPVGWPR